jgi:hypothetical protein
MIISADSQAAADTGPAGAPAATAVGAARPWANSAAAANAPSAAIFVDVRTTCARGLVRKPTTFGSRGEDEGRRGGRPLRAGEAGGLRQVLREHERDRRDRRRIGHEIAAQPPTKAIAGAAPRG